MAPQISVNRVRSSSTRIRRRVADQHGRNGCRKDPEQRAEMSRSRRTGGAGLGLAIARKIMELHGGQLTVETSPGQGSTFCLRFPDQSVS